MDPLSITCAILAVIGAGKGVVKTIRKLSLIKGAPLSLLQLNNEVSDLLLVVRVIEEYHKDGGQFRPALSMAHDNVTIALEEAKDAVLDLENLITDKLSKIGTGKANRIQWMLAEPTIVWMKERVRSAKLRLVAATNVLTWTTTTSLELRIEQLESTTVAFLSQMAMLNNRQDPFDQASFQAMASMDIEENYTESDGIAPLHAEMWNPITSSSSKPSSAMIHATDASTPLQCSQGVIEVLVNPQSNCSPSCGCACHSKYNARSPQLLDRLIGSVFVGYQGNPQGSIACDANDCLKRSKKPSVASVAYMFPSWWIWRYAISVKIAPEYQLRLLRVRSKSDPIFKALSALKLQTVRKMLLVGEASVLDVNEDGQSLLTWSIFCHGQSKQSTEIVKLLLEAGSDTKQEDQSMMTPYTYVWTGFLRHGDHQMFTKELLDMFGSSADLESLGLTSLHAAILGIGADPLPEILLATSRDDVNKRDLIGMTALAWATTRSDIDTMKQLLVKGADPNLADNQGRITLHHWVKGGNHDCLQVLLDAGADVDRPDKFGETPFLRTMYFFKHVQVRSLHLLIDRGADPQRQSHEGWTGIHLTVRWNCDDTARLDCLLRHGLDINQMDEDHMTPLMIAIVHNIHKAVDHLLQRGASHLGRMKGGRSFLHILAAYAEMETLKVLGRHQELIDSLDPDVPDDAGQTPLEIAKMRVAQKSNVAGNDSEKSASAEMQREWYEAFLMLLNNPNEEFFDAVG